MCLWNILQWNKCNKVCDFSAILLDVEQSGLKTFNYLSQKKIFPKKFFYTSKLFIVIIKLECDLKFFSIDGHYRGVFLQTKNISPFKLLYNFTWLYYVLYKIISKFEYYTTRVNWILSFALYPPLHLNILTKSTKRFI